MRVVCDTSGTCLISAATSAVSLRRATWSWRAEWKVSARIGTSSIERALTSGAEAPVGIRSAPAWSFWCSLTNDRSGSSPTRKRTTTNDCPGWLVE